MEKDMKKSCISKKIQLYTLYREFPVKSSTYFAWYGMWPQLNKCEGLLFIKLYPCLKSRKLAFGLLLFGSVLLVFPPSERFLNFHVRNLHVFSSKLS